MKTLLVLAVLLCGAGVLFTRHTPSREMARNLTAGEDEKKRIATFQLGQKLFVKKWAPSASATFPAWGDSDDLANVTRLENGVWEAGGLVEFAEAGNRVTHPWRIIFNPESKEVFGRFVGEEAEARARETVQSLPAAKEARPKPGDWLFEKYRNPLDRTTRRR